MEEEQKKKPEEEKEERPVDEAALLELAERMESAAKAFTEENDRAEQNRKLDASSGRSAGGTITKKEDETEEQYSARVANGETNPLE